MPTRRCRVLQRPEANSAFFQTQTQSAVRPVGKAVSWPPPVGEDKVTHRPGSPVAETKPGTVTVPLCPVCFPVSSNFLGPSSLQSSMFSDYNKGLRREMTGSF